MKNANWFNAMVKFGLTINAIKRNFSVSSAIAAHIQAVASLRDDSQNDCKLIAESAKSLCNQVGF